MRFKKKFVWSIIVFTLLLFLIAYIFKNKDILFFSSIILLIFFYLFIDEKSLKERLSVSLPLIITIVVIIASHSIGFFEDKQYANVQVASYHLKNEDYIITKDLIGMYLFQTNVTPPLLLQVRGNNSNFNERFLFGASLWKEILCQNNCSIYRIIVINKGKKIDNLEIEGDSFSDRITFFDVDPKIILPEGTGSFGRGNFILTIKDLIEWENRFIATEIKGDYNLSMSCNILDEKKGECNVDSYDINIYGMPDYFEGTLHILDERDNEIKTIILPKISGDAKLFRLNLKNLTFEEYGKVHLEKI